MAKLDRAAGGRPVEPGKHRGSRGVNAEKRPRRRGPRRLEPHRMALSLGLVSTAPPMIIRYGWPGVIAAVFAIAYAVYLLAGKRLPWKRR
jgi:hypothetical protein